MMKSFEEKRAYLQEILNSLIESDIIIAFSGGVDSAALLKEVCLCVQKQNKASKVYALTLHTSLHSNGDLEQAKKTAKEIGAIHKVIEVDELLEANIKENPIDRCYLCKKCLFEKILDFAKSKCVKSVIEGTNEDDTHVYRPGLFALKELGIISPLVLAGFTKADVRALAKLHGLSVADKPARPCMATRFPYGTILTYEAMMKVDRAECELSKFGFYNVRVRVHGDLARIEVDTVDLHKVIEHRETIIELLKREGYQYVTFDLEGFRSGSMDKDLV